MRPNMPGQSYIQQGYLDARLKDLAAISFHLQSRSMIAGKIRHNAVDNTSTACAGVGRRRKNWGSRIKGGERAGFNA